ncbi:MAG: hypothetical protein CL902_03550 [Dehalococcoidia bacterium]|nr:hypothetical protein [Dehalococcoidia bacterium]
MVVAAGVGFCNGVSVADTAVEGAAICDGVGSGGEVVVAASAQPTKTAAIVTNITSSNFI